MRAIWTGSISFGLVNIPISLMGVEESNQLSFSMMDTKDHAKIKYQRINAETGEEVPWADIVKYYEFPDGFYVIVTDDDFAKADPKAAKAIDIEAFVDTKQLSPLMMEKPYYIQLAKGGEKAYVLLRDAMVKTGQSAIGRVTIRTRQSLCTIMAQDEGLILILLRYASELRDMDQLKLPDKIKTTAKELELAVSLIDQLSVEWQPEAFKDEYSEALMARIEAKAKLKGKELPDDEAEYEAAPSKVIDLTELLKQSVSGKKSTKEKAAESKPKRKSS